MPCWETESQCSGYGSEVRNEAATCPITVVHCAVFSLTLGLMMERINDEEYWNDSGEQLSELESARDIYSILTKDDINHHERSHFE